MGSFGGYFWKEKKKTKKSVMDKKAKNTLASGGYVVPQVEIIKKGKNENR
jgi:hypothetical protein